MAPRARILGALAIVSACALVHAPGAAASSCPGAETEAAERATGAFEQSLLCLINERRAAAGVGPVRVSSHLAQAATRHSNDMVQNGFFDHTSPAGSTLVDRITATGYTKGARSWRLGENLAWGSGGFGTPAGIVEAWIESPPHRANLLRARFREIGLSAVRGTPSDAGDEGGITVTSDYGYRVGKKKRPRRPGRRAQLRNRP